MQGETSYAKRKLKTTSSSLLFIFTDYHKMKGNSKSLSKKKISFSSDAQRSRPGDLISSNQSETLLSVNPFMTSSPTSEKPPTNNLLLMNPFMSERGQSSASAASPDSEADRTLGKKPRQGILKRSEDNAGSQLSLGKLTLLS